MSPACCKGVSHDEFYEGEINFDALKLVGEIQS